MKIKFHAGFIALTLVATLDSQVSTAFAQGSLTPPPGAPAPTMKSLSQIEPRTPISALPFTISAGGSYYVTSNLAPGVNQNGIVIAADNVTVDLNGFTLTGGGGSSGEGVSASSARANIVVRNGTVRNWPGSGVNLYDSGSSQAIVQNIRAISNIFTGIAIKKGSRAVDCVSLGNGGRGILVDSDCLVEHCKTASNTGGGIEAGTTSQLLNNMSTGNGSGLLLTGASNIVANNIVKGNTDNYNFVAGNQLDLLLSEVPESIDWSAKVKLAGSLNVAVSNAVTITANGVTLDLDGFTISSTAPSATGTAILLTGGNTDITILNGHIKGGVTFNAGIYSGGGFANGIFYTGANPSNIRVTGVSVSGCLINGIAFSFDHSIVVESCTVQTIGGTGIWADSVLHSEAYQCGSTGISANIATDSYGYSSAGSGLVAVNANNCYAENFGSAICLNAVTANNCSGINVGGGTGLSASTANNSYGYSSVGDGLDATTANNCYGLSGGGGTGVRVDSIATGCYGSSTSGTGLSTTIANSCAGTSLSYTYHYNMPPSPQTP